MKRDAKKYSARARTTKKAWILIYKRQDKRLIIYLYPPFLAREESSVKNNR